ncbi:MAG: acyl-CoA thioesterase [Bacteriovoracaceae bacterium]
MKIKIQIPDTKGLKRQEKVRITDLNYGKHVGNQTYYEYAHDARCHLLYEMGATELDFFGTSLIMADSACQYLGELKENDDFTITVHVGEILKMGFELFYEIQSEVKSKDIARIQTTLLCFDYETNKVTRLPEAAKHKLKALKDQK